MDKLEPLNDTVSNRLFDYYRIAIDYGLDVDELTNDVLMQLDEVSSKVITDKN